MDQSKQFLTALRTLQSIDPKEYEQLLALVSQIGDLEQLEAAKTDFLAFVKLMWPGFIKGNHHKIMAKAIEDVVFGREERLIVNLAPRMTKSEFFSYLMPAWFIGHNPSMKIIQICGTADMAQGWSRKVRDLIRTEDYQRLFPGVRLKEDSKAAGRWHTSHGGEYFAVGAEGNVTGKGGDCIVRGTLISSPRGSKKIEDILPGDEVIGFDHSRGEEVTSVVRATRRITSKDVCEIRTIEGHSLGCTRDHRVFVEGRGYIPAGELGFGDRLVVGDSWCRSEEDASSSCVRPLRKGEPSSPVRGAQGFEEACDGLVLRSGVFPESPCGEVVKDQMSWMSGLGWAAREVLFGQLQEGRFLGEIPKKMAAILSGMWGDFLVKEEVLRSFLSERFSCKANDWIGKFQFLYRSCEVSVLCRFIPVHVGADQGSGQQLLRGLWFCREESSDFRWSSSHQSRYSPFERDKFGQPTGELDLPLRQLSHQASSWSTATVESVAFVGGKEFDVYDIEVAGCRNFFANGILVHNCIIIDDPTGEQQAVAAIGNPQIYDKVYNWYVGGPRQRLQPSGRIAVVQSRWATNDFTGRLLKAERETDSDFGDKWKLIELPAILNGKSIWPEYWTWERLEATRLALPPFRWNAQYLQTPGNDSSAILRREYWKRWPHPKPPQCDIKIVTMDTAFSDKEGADYTAVTTWGVFEDEVSRSDGLQDKHASKVLPQLFLLDAWKDRITFPELKAMAHKHYLRWEPDIFIVEAQATGVPLIYELRARGIPVSDYRPSRGTKHSPNTKIMRVNSVSDIMASGMVWAPETRWADDVIEECANFPGGADHDDYVDCVQMALTRFRQGGFIKLATDDWDDQPIQRRRSYY